METIKKYFKLTLVAVVAFGIAAFLFVIYADVSKGYRAGVPIKVSYKGKIIKTYEAEINVGGLTNSSEGVLPSTWSFSIKKDDLHVLDALNEAIENNKRVKVYYEEKYVALFWLGDTKHFVYDVQILD